MRTQDVLKVVSAGTTRRLALVAAIAMAFGVVAVSPASAAFIYTRGSATTQQYVYADLTMGESSNVVVREIGGNYDFVESGPVAISNVDFRCTLITPTHATCPIVDGDSALFTADAELHDGNDTIDMRTTRTAVIDGGAGADSIMSAGRRSAPRRARRWRAPGRRPRCARHRARRASRAAGRRRAGRD